VATKAIAELQAAGQPISAQTIFARMLADHPGQLTFPGQPGDPLVIWDITAPTNANKTQIHGFEFSCSTCSGQRLWRAGKLVHPSGGASFNPLVIGSQFALPGPEPLLQRGGFLREVRVPDSRGVQPSRRHSSPDWPKYKQANERCIRRRWPAGHGVQLRYQQAFLCFLRAINLTSASQRQYGRYSEQFIQLGGVRPIPGRLSRCALVAIGLRGSGHSRAVSGFSNA